MVLFPRNLWLAVLAVAFGVLAFVVPGDRIQTRSVDPLFENFDGQSVDQVTVLDGDEARVTIRRSAGDGTWTIDELFGAPAFGLRVESLISRVGAMTTLDLVGEGPGSADEFGLSAEDVRRVVLGRSSSGAPAVEGGDSNGSAGGQRVELALAPATSGGVFVRLAGSDQVFRIARFPMPPATPLSWFDDRSVAPLEELQVMEIRASGEALGDVVTVTRPPRVFDGQFFDAEGRALTRESVIEVLTRLRSLFPVDVLSEADPDGIGVGEATLRLDVTPSIGKPFHVHLAPMDSTGESGAATARWRAHRSGNDFTVALRGDAVVGLIGALRAAAASAH